MEKKISVKLGRLLGMREAFAAVAGRCSAAEAQSLKEVRDQKYYLELDNSWEGFCKRLGVSRRHVDRMLHWLDEFGPAYFHLTQMAHVTPDEYRTIAPHVSEDGVRFDGAVIKLLPENSEQVSAAVAELLTREKPAKPKPVVTVEAIAKRCEALADAVRELGELDQLERAKLAVAVGRVRVAAVQKGASPV